MSGYEESRWADKEFSENYASHADNIILERRKLIGVMVSYYGHFLAGRRQVEMLDLGCGDGTLTHEIVEAYPGARPTLVDGSSDMLGRAGMLLAGAEGADFVKASFQELLRGSPALGTYDFIFSSLAIHHLDTDEKSALYSYVHRHLNEGGSFLNIDVVLPPSAALEEWYLETWQRWAEDRGENIAGDLGRPGIATRYKANPDNKPDTLESQLASLESIGYKDVDCYYKNGIFAVFGGKK